ncbi:D-ribose pyranase [Proteocatella sphenisci]|uniref:D-ribose pyranase n=1 Tax=Proteocatella sphenisci TaxID=181070 RepID=UPI00048CBBB6|nr:D-ribose pyranase [Proteocatella sphenisci]
MKISGILNSDISRVLSYMGHTDTICIADCGLPVPDGVERIDLALKFGTPTFVETLTEVAKNMKVEKIILAEEIKLANPEIIKDVITLFPNLEISFEPHDDLKKLTKECKAVIRTGENTPYANIILQSDCIF